MRGRATSDITRQPDEQNENIWVSNCFVKMLGIFSPNSSSELLLVKSKFLSKLLKSFCICRTIELFPPYDAMQHNFAKIVRKLSFRISWEEFKSFSFKTSEIFHLNSSKIARKMLQTAPPEQSLKLYEASSESFSPWYTFQSRSRCVLLHYVMKYEFL